LGDKKADLRIRLQYNTIFAVCCQHETQYIVDIFLIKFGYIKVEFVLNR